MMTKTGICDNPATPSVINDNITGGNSLNQSGNISLTVVHNGKKYNLSFPPNSLIRQIKANLESLTNVPVDMQKLVFRGILDNNTTLSSLHVPPRDAKFMLIGMEQLTATQVRKSDQTTQEATDQTTSQSVSALDTDWSTDPEHKHVLDTFGMPVDASVGIANAQDTLSPDAALVGICDKRGGSLRLRFKPDLSELWLATPRVTHKIPLTTVHAVESQPIRDRPQYHIMALQLGPTKKSRFFIYWLPAQYVESIKMMIMQQRFFNSGSDGHAKS